MKIQILFLLVTTLSAVCSVQAMEVDNATALEIAKECKKECYLSARAGEEALENCQRKCQGNLLKQISATKRIVERASRMYVDERSGDSILSMERDASYKYFWSLHQGDLSAFQVKCIPLEIAECKKSLNATTCDNVDWDLHCRNKWIDQYKKKKG